MESGSSGDTCWFGGNVPLSIFVVPLFQMRICLSLPVLEVFVFIATSTSIARTDLPSKWSVETAALSVRKLMFSCNQSGEQKQRKAKSSVDATLNWIIDIIPIGDLWFDYHDKSLRSRRKTRWKIVSTRISPRLSNLSIGDAPDGSAVIWMWWWTDDNSCARRRVQWWWCKSDKLVKPNCSCMTRGEIASSSFFLSFFRLWMLCMYVSSVQNIARLCLLVQMVERGKEKATRRKIFQLIAAVTVIHSHVVGEKNYANEISSLSLFFFSFSSAMYQWSARRIYTYSKTTSASSDRLLLFVNYERKEKEEEKRKKTLILLSLLSHSFLSSTE